MRNQSRLPPNHAARDLPIDFRVNSTNQLEAKSLAERYRPFQNVGSVPCTEAAMEMLDLPLYLGLDPSCVNRRPTSVRF
jgi:hypothetical protein